MSNEKFTQGEWRVEITDHQLADTGDYVTDFAVATENTGIAQCFDNSVVSEEEATANCHLIAAAPEMYLMLKYLADGVRWGGIQHTDRSLAAEIEKLLKKARGEDKDE